MNKKGQLDPVIGGIIAFIFLIILLPVISSSFKSVNCEDEINQLNACISEKQNLQQNLKQCLADTSKEELAQCNVDLGSCNKNYQDCIVVLQQKENKIVSLENNFILFLNWLIVYYHQVYALVFSLGIGITLTLFKVDIHLLNQRYQRGIMNKVKEITDIIKRILHDHPWILFWIIIVIVVIQNAIRLF